MDKKSNGNIQALLAKIDALSGSKELPEKYTQILRDFVKSYQEVIRDHGDDPESFTEVFYSFIEFMKEQVRNPFQFEPYHEKMRSPVDYYKFGLDFIRPLVDLPNSTISGAKNLDYIESLLKKKKNVILFANHQIEADPHAISILLEKTHPKFGEELIFVAGTRVTTDPFAVPFSMGRNLLCIHSKKYIDNPPEEQHEKQMHNKRTMARMVELLSEGGHAIYVAPSGGRDRVNAEGIIEIAPFDPQSLGMYYLMVQKAKKPTHFFPLSLSTYHLLPPPDTTETELGETRTTRGGAIHLHFGEEIDMEHFPGAEKAKDKKELRRIRAEYLWECVNREYEKFPK